MSTLTYAIVGISIVISIGKRKMGSCINVNGKKLARYQVWFMGIFVLKVGLRLVAFAMKPWLGFLFIVAYEVYSYRDMLFFMQCLKSSI